MHSIENHHQIILDSIADGVFTVDLNWQITSFNRAAEGITGIKREQALGRPCFEVLRANVCETGCILRHTVDTETPIVNMPIHIIRADKKSIPISVNTTLLRNEAGRIVGGVETFRDLTVVNKLRRALLKQQSFEDIVSKNSKMLKLFSLLPQIAESNSTVLIEGASGTGKEIFARAIHNNSPRAKGPFVAINCGALPDTLCESELFGYKAGAFTDAKKDKPGRFALAQNGTIFLDEIGDISPAVQVRLLRVLEERVYEPLGSTKGVKTNARVVAATHRNIGELVQKGTFREDLYFRIDVIKLSLPTLAERKEDIPLLVDHFIEQLNHLNERKIVGITQEAMAALMLYDWPGNVRELENVIEYAVNFEQTEYLTKTSLPQWLTEKRELPDHQTILKNKTRQWEHSLIESMIKEYGTSLEAKKTIAKHLGISITTLYRKLNNLGNLNAPK